MDKWYTSSEWFTTVHTVGPKMNANEHIDTEDGELMQEEG